MLTLLSVNSFGQIANGLVAEYSFNQGNVLNQLGKIITISTYQNQLDISMLQSGIYFVRIICNDNQVSVKKFIKK